MENPNNDDLTGGLNMDTSAAPAAGAGDPEPPPTQTGQLIVEGPAGVQFLHKRAWHTVPATLELPFGEYDIDTLAGEHEVVVQAGAETRLAIEESAEEKALRAGVAAAKKGGLAGTARSRAIGQLERARSGCIKGSFRDAPPCQAIILQASYYVGKLREEEGAEGQREGGVPGRAHRDHAVRPLSNQEVAVRVQARVTLAIGEGLFGRLVAPVGVELVPDDVEFARPRVVGLPARPGGLRLATRGLGRRQGADAQRAAGQRDDQQGPRTAGPGSDRAHGSRRAHGLSSHGSRLSVCRSGVVSMPALGSMVTGGAVTAPLGRLPSLRGRSPPAGAVTTEGAWASAVSTPAWQVTQARGASPAARCGAWRKRVRKIGRAHV